MERPWGTAPNPALFLSEKEGQRTLQSPRIRAVEDNASVKPFSKGLWEFEGKALKVFEKELRRRF